MTYNVITINPQPAQKENMIALLKNNYPVWGIEFTLPTLKEFIEFNLDDQHIEGARGKAAIEIALTYPLPPEGTTFAIVRPDADALGAIAIMNLRQKYNWIEVPEKITENALYIAKEDAFGRGEWTGTPACSEDEHSNFKALSALALNFRIPIQDRIEKIQLWIENGIFDNWNELYRHTIMAMAFTIAETKVTVLVEDRLALVESRHQGATEVGYAKCPVLVIVNHAFSFQGAEPHTKYTICAWKHGLVDFVGLEQALNTLEQNGRWGGGPTIKGSPQGISPSLSEEEVIEQVKKHLL